MRYAVIGTGAVGGYYGAHLQRAGCDVHFLLHRDYEHVAAHGLSLRSPDGDFDLPSVKAYDRAEVMPRCEVVLVALKATRNDLLAGILPHVTMEGGLVVLMQNGLRQEDRVSAAVPGCEVAAGLCFICSTKTTAGLIEHQDYGRVRLAGTSPRLDRVAADLTRAGIEVVRSDDLWSARWHKLVWNVPFNGLSVVLQTDTGQLVGHPAARVLARDLMDEVVAGAAACGARIEDGFADRMMSDTESMEPYATSMLIDYRNGREMEVEAIFGEPTRAAREHGRELPRMESLYRQLVFLNDARKGHVAGDR